MLLYECWEIIDQISLNFGLPQQVYCPVLSTVEGVAGSAAPDRQQRLYLTEDSAIVTMKFNDTLSGNLLAGRAAVASSTGNQQQKWLIAQGQDTLVRDSGEGGAGSMLDGLLPPREHLRSGPVHRGWGAELGAGPRAGAPMRRRRGHRAVLPHRLQLRPPGSGQGVAYQRCPALSNPPGGRGATFGTAPSPGRYTGKCVDPSLSAVPRWGAAVLVCTWDRDVWFPEGAQSVSGRFRE